MHNVNVLIAAAAMIKDNCEKIEHCSKCIFHTEGTINGCALFEPAPIVWSLDGAMKRVEDINNKELFEHRTLFNLNKEE